MDLDIRTTYEFQKSFNKKMYGNNKVSMSKMNKENELFRNQA